MRALLLTIALGLYAMSYGQQNEKISTIDFVQILNNNKEEAIYYYQNNWKVLREMALEKEYIHSYEVLEPQMSEEAPFELMLITTYLGKDQYDSRETHFEELIKAKGPLSLMNEKKPNQFRKTLFNKEIVRHWK
ncbi:hypothetical protein [uncultured Croceitalea sp.]|uniref:hypothetical protein n=1 Tax=uncultured Croceitalea sp. TaxID=1798908 RepID=UPI0033063D8B